MNRPEANAKVRELMGVLSEPNRSEIALSGSNAGRVSQSVDISATEAMRYVAALEILLDDAAGLPTVAEPKPCPRCATSKVAR